MLHRLALSAVVAGVLLVLIPVVYCEDEVRHVQRRHETVDSTKASSRFLFGIFPRQLLDLFRRRAEPIVSLQLIDTKTGKVVATLKDDTRINVSSLVSSDFDPHSLTVRALTGARTQSVTFQTDITSKNNPVTVNHIATKTPFTMCGGSDTPCDYLVSQGVYSVTATAHSCRQARCGSSKPLTVALSLPYTCDRTNDTCRTPKNLVCDVGLGFCPPNSDCLDCDPCFRFFYTSCEACTTAPAGCVWCGAQATCYSPGSVSHENLTCPTSEFVSTCTKATPPIFSDPLFDAMVWMYDMINVQDVWKSGVTGKGIGIRINDVGVDHTHPEFSAKFDTEGSCSIYTPAHKSQVGNHGTACASLAAGSANSSCSVGIAPDAHLSACRMLSSYNSDPLASETDDSSYLYKRMTTMHVSSNSHGGRACLDYFSFRRLNVQTCPFLSTSALSPCNSSACAGVDWSNTKPNRRCEIAVVSYCRNDYEKDVRACTSFLDLFVECQYSSQSIEEQQALIEGISNGRNGKGIVYVFSSGNDFYKGADVNFEGTLNNRFVISVGAVGKDKVHASYSTPGAALFVTAPGSSVETSAVAMVGGGCTAPFVVGTSYSTPVVAGVVALMLQINGNLTWRDVQGIIALTSQKVFPNDPSWTTNAAGIRHSYLYGFGVIDARAAVEAAKTWINYKPEQQFIAESGPVNVTIAEFQTPNVWAVSTVNVTAPVSFLVESVLVYLDLTHSSRGDLDILLVSPQGTTSILAPGERPESKQRADDERWRLMTVRNWGEPVNGNWSLQLVDRSRGDYTTCVSLPGWSVNVTVPRNNTQFRPGTLHLDCFYFSRINACSSPSFNFRSFFAGIVTGINDLKLTDSKGVSLTQACCECGGGRLASTVPDVLKSWRIALYGH